MELSNQVSQERLRVTMADVRMSSGIEVSPVVVGDSGRYDKAEDLLGLWAAAIGLALMWLFFAKVSLAEPTSMSKSEGSTGLLAVFATIAIGFVGGALIMTQIGRLRRLFVPREQLLQNVQTRAKQAFNELHVKHRDNPFLLVFVSIYERAACIMPSESLMEKFSQADLDSLCRNVELQLSGNVDDAMASAIRQVCRVLNSRQQENKDKLPASANPQPA